MHSKYVICTVLALPAATHEQWRSRGRGRGLGCVGGQNESGTICVRIKQSNALQHRASMCSLQHRVIHICQLADVFSCFVLRDQRLMQLVLATNPKTVGALRCQVYSCLLTCSARVILVHAYHQCCSHERYGQLASKKFSSGRRCLCEPCDDDACTSTVVLCAVQFGSCKHGKPAQVYKGHETHWSWAKQHKHTAQTDFAGRHAVRCFSFIGYVCSASLHIAACKADAGDRAHQRILRQSLQHR